MPFSMEMNLLRDIVRPESLRALVEDEALRGFAGKQGGLLQIVDRVFPELDPTERAWLGSIPPRQLEAIRAVLESVATGSEELELDIQFEPAYDFSVKIFEFDKHVVVRMNGPFPGQPYPRESFKRS